MQCACSLSYNIHTDGLSSTETSLLNFRPILPTTSRTCSSAVPLTSKLNISQAEFTLYTLKPAVLSLPPMLMIGRHHSLIIIQARSLSNNPKYCCLLLLHPISNQVTPIQVPSTSPVPSSPLLLHLVCIISPMDCTLISFILPQTSLCVTCPSHFFELFF